MTLTLEDRVTTIEEAMQQLIQITAQTSLEVRELKTEMAEFKDEMAEFKNEMAEFKNEMAEFKDEMQVFKTESRKRWGELSNKLGTMVEDLVAPSITQIVQQVVDCAGSSVDSAIRVKRTNAVGQRREFDAIATCADYLFVNETKSRLSVEEIKYFTTETLPQVRNFFPEHAARQVVGIVASLYVDESVVRYGERQGLVVLGFGEDLMSVLNSPEFVPKIW